MAREQLSLHVPLLLSFWFTVAAYVVHCIDESLLGGSFVEKVRQHWWPEYSWTKFFWFNTGYFVVMMASIVLYDFPGGSWMILPLAWVIERVCTESGMWAGRFAFTNIHPAWYQAF